MERERTGRWGGKNLKYMYVSKSFLCSEMMSNHSVQFVRQFVQCNRKGKEMRRKLE